MNTTAARAAAGLHVKPASPHICLIIPRGEALRNFVYSKTLPALAESARVSLLTVTGKESVERFATGISDVYPLEYFPPGAVVSYLRGWIHMAHFRRLGTMIAREQWERAVLEQPTIGGKLRKMLLKGLAFPLANDTGLRLLSTVESSIHSRLRRTHHFHDLLNRIRPDLVFNTSHIHGPAAEEPLRAARDLGIRTAGFIFSWDNLYNRGRILSPYDDYLVWNETMAEQLKRFYPAIDRSHIHITGTPQMDFHLEPEYLLERFELARAIGIDPLRPFVLYTTGVDRHVVDEHLHVEAIIRALNDLDISPRPQLVVRTYVKGTSAQMMALAERKLPDVVFPPVLWDEKWYTPQYEDLKIYTSLLHHCAMGVNVSSTVSLELLIHNKPVLNIGFDPPGGRVPKYLAYSRYLEIDHYRPVATSGAVMIARNPDEVRSGLLRGLQQPDADAPARRRFVREWFGQTLGGSGQRVARTLLELSARRADER